MLSIKYIILLTSVTLGAIGQIFFKIGISKNQSNGFNFFISLITNLWVISGFAFYGFSFLLWMLVLKYFDVSYARSVTSIGYILTFTIAVIFLNEPATIKKIAGILVISFGVYLMK